MGVGSNDARSGRALWVLVIVALTGSILAPSPAGARVEHERLAGPDRYATAAAAASTAASTEHVIIATGRGFADALGAGAARPGLPLLLTEPSTLPAATAERLATWRPELVEVVGGPQAVADDVLAQVADITGGRVVRVAGSDRYATAAALLPDGPVEEVLVASGSNFPDALAGVPLAVQSGAALVLTDRDTLPEPTRGALVDLAPGRVTILGGPVAVGPAVADQIAAVTGVTPHRIAGGDRFATAAMTARERWSSTSTVHLATGHDFVDALAVGPVSGGAPLLLATHATLPDITACTLHHLAPDRLVVVGGANAISAEVEADAVRAVDVPPHGCSSVSTPPDEPVDGGEQGSQAPEEPAEPADPGDGHGDDAEADSAMWPGRKPPRPRTRYMPCPSDDGPQLPEVPEHIDEGVIVERHGTDLQPLPGGDVAALGPDDIFVLDPSSLEVERSWARPAGWLGLLHDDTGRLWVFAREQGQPSRLVELMEGGGMREVVLPVEAVSVAVVGEGAVAVVIPRADGPALEISTVDGSVRSTWTADTPGSVHRVPGSNDIVARPLGRRLRSDGHVVADVEYRFGQPEAVGTSRLLASSGSGWYVLDVDTMLVEGTVPNRDWASLDPSGTWLVWRDDDRLEVFDSATMQPNRVVVGLDAAARDGVWTGTHVVEQTRGGLRVTAVSPAAATGRTQTPAGEPEAGDSGTWTGIPGDVRQVLAVPATNEFWVTNHGLDRVDVIDAVSGRPVDRLHVGNVPWDLALGPDGRVVVALAGTASVAVVDPLTRATEHVLLLEGDVRFPKFLAALPDQVLVTTSTATVALQESSTTATSYPYFSRLAASPNGRWLATNNRLLDRTTGEERRYFASGQVEQVLDDGRVILDQVVVDANGDPAGALDALVGQRNEAWYPLEKRVAVDHDAGVAWSAYNKGLVADDIRHGFAGLEPRFAGMGCTGDRPTGVAVLPGADRVAVAYPQGLAVVHVGAGDLRRHRPPRHLTPTGLGWVDHESHLSAYGGVVDRGIAWFVYPQGGWLAGYDVDTGTRTALHDLGLVPIEVDALGDGDLVVALAGAGLLRIDPTTGNRSFIVRGNYDEVAVMADGRMVAGEDSFTTTHGSGQIIQPDGSLEELGCCPAEVGVSPGRGWGAVTTGHKPYVLAPDGTQGWLGPSLSWARDVAISDRGVVLHGGRDVVDRDGTVRRLPDSERDVAAGFLPGSSLALRDGAGSTHVIDVETGARGPALPGPSWSQSFEAREGWVVTSRGGGELIDLRILRRDFLP